MIIILEGPDGAGKTTLADELVDRYGFNYQHQGPYPEIPGKGIVRQNVEKILATAKQPTVFDRLHVGERVYGPVYRGTDRLGAHGHRAVDRYLAGRSAVLVVVLDDEHEIIKCWRARQSSEMYKDEDKLREVCRRYSDGDLIVTSYLPATMYRWRTGSTAERLMRWVRKNAPPLNRGPGIGWFKPGNVLVVGEQAGGDRSINAPFVDDGGCSAWFNQLLVDNHVPESELYWINALTLDGALTDARFLRDLRPRAVIALGKWAQRWVDEVDVSYPLDLTGAKIYRYAHPQHHKRFKHKEPYPALQAFNEEMYV